MRFQSILVYPNVGNQFSINTECQSVLYVTRQKAIVSAPKFKIYSVQIRTSLLVQYVHGIIANNLKHFRHILARGRLDDKKV